MGILSLAAAMLLAAHAQGGMAIQDDGKALTVLDGEQPVLVYRYEYVDPPAGVDAHFKRSTYIHPLYGLDGEVLTQDFPADHYHHRGVFWAWPESTVGGKKIDVWALDGVREKHEKFLTKEADPAHATIADQSVWVFDAEPDQPKVRESVWLTVLPATKQSRAIDFRIVLENVSGEELVLRGATTESKGYGGFSFRPDAERKPMVFTCATGTPEKDVLSADTPWADLSFPKTVGGKKYSGVAIFQHSQNPGYPHPGWLFRHYGFLGASWPHTEPYTLKAGDKIEIKYRLLLHRGNAKTGKVKEAFDTYVRENKSTQ